VKGTGFSPYIGSTIGKVALATEEM
jgi:hypothetical protein